MLVHLVLSLLPILPLLPPTLHSLATTHLLPFLLAYNITVNLPNVLRQSCLVIISTYCHYYGDIPERVRTHPPTHPPTHP